MLRCRNTLLESYRLSDVGNTSALRRNERISAVFVRKHEFHPLVLWNRCRIGQATKKTSKLGLAVYCEWHYTLNTVKIIGRVELHTGRQREYTCGMLFSRNALLEPYRRPNVANSSEFGRNHRISTTRMVLSVPSDGEVRGSVNS